MSRSFHIRGVEPTMVTYGSEVKKCLLPLNHVVLYVSKSLAYSISCNQQNIVPGTYVRQELLLAIEDMGRLNQIL